MEPTAGKRRPSFVDGYVVRRLREQQQHSWEETYGYSQTAASCSLEYGSRQHDGLWAAKSRSSIAPQSGLQLTPKLEGAALHSLTGLRRDSRFSGAHSNEPPTLLQKRYRYTGSVPVAAKITADTNSTAPTKKPSSLSSNSPSASRSRGHRKIRRGYSMAKSPPTLLNSVACDSGKRSSLGSGKSQTTPPMGVSHQNHDFSLPLVGQRSEEFQDISPMRRKSREQDRSKRPCQKKDVCSLRVSGKSRDVRLHNRLKKSCSVGAGLGGGASEWGCDGVRRWKSACCEDTREDFVATLAEDSLSIEDATDESVTEGESTVEDGGSLGGEGVGFSVEDLTDLEDGDDGTTTDSTASHTGDLPHADPLPCDSDMATYSLLMRASQQLDLLSIASDSDDSTSSESAHLPQPRRDRKTSRGQRVIKTVNSEPKSEDPTIPNEKTELAGHSTTTEMEALAVRDPSPPLTPSLFPGLEPTIHFPMPNEPYTPLPPEMRCLLKWKMSTITPNVIKNCIARVGFTPSTKGKGWLGYWGKHMKSGAFRAVQIHQKVNHFPGSFEIGRKDRLWRNLSRLQSRVGRKDLDFVPLTFVLPHDLRLLKREWEARDRQKWILKPPAAARGIGVRVVHKWNQIPKKRPVIVQKYIADPLCIKGSKVDLRIYVYVSSYDPLMIYVFPGGLTRFATCKYSTSTRSLSNRFIHLTNYSVNKKNSQFSQNSDETACQGHKWGLLALWKYMRNELRVDTDTVWSSIVQLVVKTIICSESHCSSLVKTYAQSSFCCHELFGFDVILDRKLKPWLVEVNISPSLHSGSKLDVNIKGQLVRDLLNIAGFKLPATTTAEAQRCTGLTVEERRKHSHFLQRNLPEHERRKILDKLTPGDIAVLMQAEDEFSRRGMFQRVYPTHESGIYRKYFESEKYNNILLEQWLVQYQHCPDKGVQLLRTPSKL